MSNTKEKTKTSNAESNTTGQQKVKVLYQFLGGQWYAFTADGSEVYFGKVPLKASTRTLQNSKPKNNKK